MAIAIDCFARYGYAGTSIDRIARAAGVTKGALYYHFRDKEQLLFEAVKERIGAFEQHVLERVDRASDPAEALRRIARICAQNAIQDNHRRFILTLMVEALDTNARLSALFRDMMQRFRGFLGGIVEIGQQQGVFRPDVKPSTAAGVYAGAVMGAEIEYYQDPAAVDLGEHLRTFLDSYLTWLAAPSPRANRS